MNQGKEVFFFNQTLNRQDHRASNELLTDKKNTSSIMQRSDRFLFYVGTLSNQVHLGFLCKIYFLELAGKKGKCTIIILNLGKTRF